MNSGILPNLNPTKTNTIADLLASRVEPLNHLTICQKDTRTDMNDGKSQKRIPNLKNQCHCAYSRHSLVLIKNWQHRRQVCSRRAPFFSTSVPVRNSSNKDVTNRVNNSEIYIL